MNSALVDGIVKAVLYEGYMLYPYRPSAVKNRQRFNFGVVYPRAYSEAQGGTDLCLMQTECLVEGNKATQCAVRVRFLRMVSRSIEKLRRPVSELASELEANLEKVERLEVNGKTFQAWQEAVEETIEVTEFNLSALASQPMQWPFRMSANQEKELIRDENGFIAGIISRDKSNLRGTIEISAASLVPGLHQLRVSISNDSPLDGGCTA
ncbi:MAG: hypothetical protein ACRD4K_14840, partial [Candidatus Acidiferrales bacterium]